MEKPIVKHITLPSGAELVRFSSLPDIYYYDIPANNPAGIAVSGYGEYNEEGGNIQRYFRERLVINSYKQKIIDQAQKEMSMDHDFLKLIYKGKSQKRKFELNKFTGNLSIVQYAIGAEKLFKRSIPGAKKQSLNLAFQVGTFVGGNYNQSFIRILKVIMMCQAMNIAVNIDMFDSDTRAIHNNASYVIACVAKSNEKLNFRDILAASHPEFFRVTLFNGYSASGRQYRIGTFLDESRIIRDLSPMYDIIGGNMLNMNDGSKELASKILKIGLR